MEPHTARQAMPQHGCYAERHAYYRGLLCSQPERVVDVCAVPQSETHGVFSRGREKTVSLPKEIPGNIVHLCRHPNTAQARKQANKTHFPVSLSTERRRQVA